MARWARSEPVLALQRMQWLLWLGEGRVLVLFVFIVRINLSQALTITRVARFLDHLKFILFMGFVLVLF